jgi:hypothetical protein
MDTQTDTKVFLSLEEGRVLEAPCINAQSLDFLLEEAWNLLLGKLRETTPKPVMTLVQDLSCFEYYRRQLETNHGLVEKCENEMAHDLIFEFINVIGELNWWH